MIEDPIVAEVRRYRKEHAAEHGNDLKRIVKALRKRERESKRTLLNPGPKFAWTRPEANERLQRTLLRRAAEPQR